VYLKFCRIHEDLNNTARSVNMRAQDRKPFVHVGIHLFTNEHEIVEWNPPLPDERLYMPAQVQIELRTVTQCDEVLRGIERVEQGDVPNFSYDGTAWDVFISPNSVEFVYSIMDGVPGGRIDLKFYREVLKAWRKFLLDENCEQEIFYFPDSEN